MRRPPWLVVAFAGLTWAGLAGACLAFGDAAAQDFRGRAAATVRWVELQPVVRDTVSRERVVEAGDGTLTFEGRRVTCTPGLPCTFYRALPEERAAHGTQDLSLTAWGLGVRGLSVTALGRARFRLGGDLVWPRSDDAFDAMLAYAELQRGGWRFRAGRQETLSGLGFWGYDGASARWRPFRALAAEAYAGRSLARALSAPHQEALRGLEDFIPERDAWLLGGFARVDLGEGTVLGLRYQREIWSDRSGLLQERASLDARTVRFHPLRLEGSVDWDGALGRLGRSHLTAAHPLPAPGLEMLIEATVRRHVPYFQLSTIWGFFDPVPYHEVLLGASLLPLAGLGADVSVGRRRYGDTHVQDFLAPLEDGGWRAEAGLRAAPWRRWATEVRYRLEWGAGASMSAADAQVRWRAAQRLELGATGTAFQQVQEFRVGEGRVWGGGLTAAAELPWGARLDGGAALYRQDPRRRSGAEAWGQSRAWTSLTVPFGSDPGQGRRWRR